MFSADFWNIIFWNSNLTYNFYAFVIHFSFKSLSLGKGGATIKKHFFMCVFPQTTARFIKTVPFAIFWNHKEIFAAFKSISSNMILKTIIDLSLICFFVWFLFYHICTASLYKRDHLFENTQYMDELT